MNIKVLGAHNCESQATRCVSLIVDNILALDAGGLTSSLSFAAQQKLRAVLLTHQHYDHIRDVPFLAMNMLLHEATINIYGARPVYESLASHLLDGQLYPNFLATPPARPTINFTIVESYQPFQAGGYTILPVPVSHAVPTTGYQVTAPDGKSLFYTGDTGPGLSGCWPHIAPQLLVVELTAPDKYRDSVREVGHLTPALLKGELAEFKKAKGYLPRVLLVHMNPRLETEIAGEIATVAASLGTSITLAREGIQIDL